MRHKSRSSVSGSAASLSISNLVKEFDTKFAVNDVSVRIEPGECVALLGPSGCGKTTTLRCVAGLESGTSGTISINDSIVASPSMSVPPERRGIGMVFQNYAIWPHLSVFENVAFGMRVDRRPKSETDLRVEETLELVGLAGYGPRSASLLSGGEQQRVALARAVIVEPSILLFDEPLSNLDAKLRERMRFELRELQQRLGLTSLYVTHDQEEAMVVADRIVVMNKGQIEEVGTPQEVYRRPTSRFAASFIGSANILDCRVVGPDDDYYLVETEGGARFRAADPNDVMSSGILDKVAVLVRPEAVQLVEADASVPTKSVNCFSGVVTHNAFLGTTSDVRVLGDDSTVLHVSVSPAQDFYHGMRVSAMIQPDNAILLAD